MGSNTGDDFLEELLDFSAIAELDAYSEPQSALNAASVSGGAVMNQFNDILQPTPEELMLLGGDVLNPALGTDAMGMSTMNAVSRAMRPQQQSMHLPVRPQPGQQVGTVVRKVRFIGEDVDYFLASEVESVLNLQPGTLASMQQPLYSRRLATDPERTALQADGFRFDRSRPLCLVNAHDVLPALQSQVKNLQLKPHLCTPSQNLAKNLRGSTLAHALGPDAVSDSDLGTAVRPKAGVPPKDLRGQVPGQRPPALTQQQQQQLLAQMSRKQAAMSPASMQQIMAMRPNLTPQQYQLLMQQAVQRQGRMPFSFVRGRILI